MFMPLRRWSPKELTNTGTQRILNKKKHKQDTLDHTQATDKEHTFYDLRVHIVSNGPTLKTRVNPQQEMSDGYKS